MTEPNYNDGLWHGWNGGECPVHPKTVVEGFCAVTHSWGSTCGASFVPWDGVNHVVAFRVVKEYREPLEWWVLAQTIHETREIAVAFRDRLAQQHPGLGYESLPIIHVREVQP